MHKIYENNDLAMYFKKRYCHCCGQTLQRKKTERIVRKNDPEHSAYCHIGTTYKPYGDILVVGKEYYCASCDKSFSCDKQAAVISAQKHCKRKIVTEEEIANLKNSNVKDTKDTILKMRWLLLIPIVGGLLCSFKIFNSGLREKTKSNDLQKLLVSSIAIFLCVALVVKLILSTFNNDFIDNYRTLLMILPSSLSFNIPVLWYINHTF